MSNSNLPRHIAIIMDGNGRWAKKRFLPRYAGHKAGVETVRRVLSLCAKKGIEVLTLFTFSSENWRRPKEEVSLLMNLFMMALKREVKILHKNNVRLRIIGVPNAFSEKLQKLISEAEILTKDNSGITLVIAANYGGRWDIINTAKHLTKQVLDGTLQVEDINESIFRQNLSLGDLPEPDLFIRTGGEKRMSNFLIWQLAYTELYFTDTLWPDFDDVAFQQALDSFSSRERRFGRTSEQVQQQENNKNA